nr:aucubin synthase [Vitex agnus-castus]
MLDYVIITLLTILVVWAWKIFSWAWLEPRRMERFLRSQGLKGNSYRFLLGDSREIADMYKEANSKPLGPYDDIAPRVMPFIEKTIKTYGTNAFAWIGPTARIIISEPELMRVVLNKHRNYQKSFRVSNKIIRLAIGGLVYYEGDEWSKSRMKLNPAFHLDKLKQMVPTMHACTENILNQWKNKMSEDGFGVVDVLHYLEDISGSVVTQTLFHTTFNDEMRRNFHHLRDLTIMTDTASKPFNFPGSEYLPSQTKKKAKEMEKEVRQSFTKMIDERLKQRRAGERNVDPDLFDLFLEGLYNDDKKLSNRERKRIIEEAIAQTKLFYFAGYDTTSNLMVWTMITLAIHQDWQTRAREEVFQVLGDNMTLTNDGLSQLKVVNMILHEVLRLYPPVMELSRVVEEETQLGDLRIPKGVFLQLPVALLHRRPDIWGKDALDFRPDRFAEGVLKAANGQAAFMPFSWGPRICIGQNFALMEGKAFMAQLLRTFSFELAPTYKHAPYAAFTIQPQYGAPLLLRKL